MLFLSLIESNRLQEYRIENWGGVEDNPADFVCYNKVEMKNFLASAGLHKIECHELKWSDQSHYGQEDVKRRLEERGVSPFQVIGIRPA